MESRLNRLRELAVELRAYQKGLDGMVAPAIAALIKP